VGLVLAAFWLLAIVQPFLAVTYRVDLNVLVVEGWVHEFAIRAGAEELRRGGYRRIYTTGGPVRGNDGYSGDQATAASAGAHLLRQAGVSAGLLEMVPARKPGRDQTYDSSVALRDWFRQNPIAVGSMDVVTEGTHARRTRLLFHEAVGKGVVIGISAVANPDYDAKHWWRYSEGVREVTGEAFTCLYARFLLYPGDAGKAPRKAQGR
jgi:hypothetical protein